MKKQIIFLVLLFVQAVLYAQPRFDSNVFMPVKPKVTDQLQIIYNAKDKDLEFSDDVNAAFFLFEDFGWKQISLQMQKKSEGVWTVTVPVKQSTAFIAVKFYQGALDQPDIIDNNQDKGYAVALTDAKGKPVQGAFLGEAAFQVPTIAAGGIFSYYKNQPPPMSGEYLKELAEKEFALSGKQHLRYFQSFMNLQKLALGDGFPTYAKKLITEELKQKEIADEVLNQLYTFASVRLKDKELFLLIQNRVNEDFPNGSTARFIAYNNIKGSGPDKSEIIASYENFLNRFPIQKWREHPNGQGFIYYAVYRGLGSAYFDSKQMDKFAKLYDDIDFRTGNELMRWNIMRAYMFKTVGKDSLYALSEKILPKLIARRGDNSYKDDFDRQAQADSNVVKNLDDRLFTHISLLNDLKKYPEARSYFLLLSEDGKYNNAELNEINLQVLEGLGDEKQILPLLEMSARYNTMTPRMFDKLKAIYLKANGNNESGYQAYLAGLKSDEEKVAMKAYVDHNWVDHPMPDFRLETADGLFITPLDWKDKIVVVDFWATWCRPCIMAFPGMQLLVDKYAHDDHVAIYMVGTMQTGDYKNKSVNYVRKEGFRFNLLHDSVNPKTNEQDMLFKQLVPLFGDSSIPRKIIVKNGRVRYCSGGYSGSPSKLMDELSLAIETLKNEK
ncbi:TlpA disulfide reductase family protein [Sphingobacterium sp. DR205]|uniref:TlpA family protein disulfide reductase n=1 Tax=Sphingobacterium sp. DR205 TaxID=2713573 RepID=UPI0013E51035|nr:TlpA disulfide reductase family protein [Sphingobacterium sp. DR205]QIH35925.1 TlpA family protein disulfide reductase [Sphingobacterium sp. DR205]